MNVRITRTTAARILRQLRGDHRTVALMIVVPCVLLGLLAWIYADLPGDVFNRIGPALLGVFPFVVMFIVTSIATLRERTNGTLERLLTTPLGKGDLMLGYALAFGAMAVLQALVATGFAVWVCRLDIAGPLWLLVVIALFDAVLGTALGLLASGFARTEFQAVQFMPALVLPQFLLCGLLVPRELLPPGTRGDLERAAPVVRRRRHEGRHRAGRPAQRGAAQPGRHRPVDRAVPRPGQPHPAPPHPLTRGARPAHPGGGHRCRSGARTRAGSDDPSPERKVSTRHPPQFSREGGMPRAAAAAPPLACRSWTPVTCSGEPCSSCPTPTS